MSPTEINWCVSGKIEEGHLITQNGESIKIRPNQQLGVGLGTLLLKCIPLTDSTGAVTGVTGVEQLSEIAPSYCIGRVTQLGKRGDTVLVKVSPSRKITLHTEYKLAVAGLYKLSFEYREGGLYVVAAERLDEIEKVAQPEIQPQAQAQAVTKRALSIEESWGQKLEALIYTEFPNFLLSEQRSSNGVLEWSGVVGDSQIRIQGIVGSTALSIHSFTKAEVGLEETATDFLRVTPLGAARSIGASCFRVEIGNYEIVLDAGTRPKGDQPLPAFEHLKNPNLILITHAHSANIGALPVLHSLFPAAPMICYWHTRNCTGDVIGLLENTTTQ